LLKNCKLKINPPLALLPEIIGTSPEIIGTSPEIIGTSERGINSA